MKLDDFTLKRITFEIRYREAYLLWDRCGYFWKEVCKLWPDIQAKAGEPNLQSFSIKDQYQFQVELKKAFVIGFDKRVSEASITQQQFIGLHQKTFQVSTYDRIGCRLIFEKRCESSAESSNLLISSGLLNPPTGKHFNIDGDVVQTEKGTDLFNSSP